MPDPTPTPPTERLTTMAQALGLAERGPLPASFLPLLLSVLEALVTRETRVVRWYGVLPETWGNAPGRITRIEPIRLPSAASTPDHPPFGNPIGAYAVKTDPDPTSAPSRVTDNPIVDSYAVDTYAGPMIPPTRRAARSKRRPARRR